MYFMSMVTITYNTAIDNLFVMYELHLKKMHLDI